MLSPLVSQRLRMFLAKNNKEDLGVLKELIESGDITPIVDKTYKLSEAAQAVANVGERYSRGNPVISMR